MDIVEALFRFVDVFMSVFPARSNGEGSNECHAQRRPPATARLSRAGSRSFTLREEDNGRTLDVRLGDRVLIVLVLHPTSDTSSCLVQPDAKTVLVFEDVVYGGSRHVGCRVVGRDDSELTVEYLRSDGAVDSKWSVLLRVME